MQVGLSEPFAQWLLPLVSKHFPDFPQRSAQDFYAAENVIKSPSLIRVEADEVRRSSAANQHACMQMLPIHTHLACLRGRQKSRPSQLTNVVVSCVVRGHKLRGDPSSVETGCLENCLQRNH
jgi:hypothetical protein